MSSLLTKLITFRSERMQVVHTTGFDVSAAQAFEICQDYAAFLGVMLPPQQIDPGFSWIKGGPGEVGGELRYLLERDGSSNTIVERVVECSADPTTGVCTLAWEQLSSTPQLPLQSYGCTWVLTPEPGDPGRCRLTWTRHFDAPMVLGLLPLTAFMQESFRKSAQPIIDNQFRPYFTRTYPSGTRRLPKASDRVLIVGAGPSGLHMAHLLRTRLGIDDITIVDRTDRYGGKTLSVPDKTNPGIVHELGTCYLHPAYFAVRALLQEIKAHPACDLERFADEVAPINYRIRAAGKSDLTLEEWVTANLQNQPRFSLWALSRVLFPKADTELELVAAKVKYNGLHSEYFGQYRFTLPPRLTPEAMDALDMSFGQFLDSHGLGALKPILAYGQTCQGYGSIETTPAFWAMCWITPQLLDGYFAVLRPHLPKKAMLVTGWGSLWDMIIKVDALKIELNTAVNSVHRPLDGSPIVAVTTCGERRQTRQFDYLVVAAPVLDRQENEPCFMELFDSERAVMRQNMTNCQFKTALFKLHQPEPFLNAHLTLNSDKVLGAEVGRGDVFASRDSYLAMHPEYCSLQGLKNDPARGEFREQMAYQYIETGHDLDEDAINAKFDDWTQAELGDAKNFEILQFKTWAYFQRPDRKGLLAYAPWRIMELQGKNRTLFVHASTFFESVLDIVNYNNMLVSGLGGALNILDQPPTDAKPEYYESDHWKIFYNPVVRVMLALLDVVLGSVWTLAYILTYPFMSLVVTRILRKYMQTAFHTANPGGWWRFNMRHFLRVSPSVICVVEDREDPVITLAKDTLQQDHPDIPQVNWALKWNYNDYRVGIRVWQKLVKPTYLSFITPAIASKIRSFAAHFPVVYNYLFSWGAVASFNTLTGYSVRVEDAKGGGCYVPKCNMLATARKEYGEDVGTRICTRVCKVFTEEFMESKGLPCSLQPNFEKGSCMIRGVSAPKAAYSDHSTAWWMSKTAEPAAPAEEAAQGAQGEQGERVKPPGPALA